MTKVNSTFLRYKCIHALNIFQLRFDLRPVLSCSYTDLHAYAALRLVCRLGSFDGSHLNFADYFSFFHLRSPKLSLNHSWFNAAANRNRGRYSFAFWLQFLLYYDNRFSTFYTRIFLFLSSSVQYTYTRCSHARLYRTTCEWRQVSVTSYFISGIEDVRLWYSRICAEKRR